MGEPVRENIDVPESYSPKNRPIIIDMAETATERNAAPQRFAVQAMEDSAYNDGVPMLNWGEWKDRCHRHGGQSDGDTGKL